MYRSLNVLGLLAMFILSPIFLALAGLWAVWEDWGGVGLLATVGIIMILVALAS